MKKAVYIVNMVATLVIMILAIFVLVGALIARAQNEVPGVFGYTVSVVVTGSMEPQIMAGDLVVAKKGDLPDVEIGDYIIFRSTDPSLGGIVIIHEAIRFNYDDGGNVVSVVTKGTNNPDEDEYPVKDVISIYKFKSTFLGKFLLFVTDLRNILFFGVTIALLFITVKSSMKIYEYVKNSKKEEEDEEEKTEEETEDNK